MISETQRLWLLRGLLLAIAIAGIAIIYFLPELKSVGEAFIIAGILGLTVDSYVKQHLLKEASQDISKYLIGYQLPDEIQDKIE